MDASGDLSNLENNEIFFAIQCPNEQEIEHVYSDKLKALDALRKLGKLPRMKQFSNRQDAVDFSKTLVQDIIVTIKTDAKPKEQLRLGRMMVAVKTENLAAIESLSADKRYLVTSVGTPTILQVGFRYNALHVATFHGRYESTRLLLRLILDVNLVRDESSRVVGGGDADAGGGDGGGKNAQADTNRGAGDSEKEEPGENKNGEGGVENRAQSNLVKPEVVGGQSEESIQQSSDLLFDMYLNSPDKGSLETPLHFACKFGYVEIVRLLLSVPEVKQNPLNHDNHTPQQIVCSRRGDAVQKEQIQKLFREQFYVPLIRAIDDTEMPSVGRPSCSVIQVDADTAANAIFSSPPSSNNHSPLTSTPFKTIQFNRSIMESPVYRSPRSVRAFAGPMDEQSANRFQENWTKLRDEKGSSLQLRKRWSQIKRSDFNKGLERIGRELAHGKGINWTEYWDFLNEFVDLSSDKGLALLNKYLSGKLADEIKSRKDANSLISLEDLLAELNIQMISDIDLDTLSIYESVKSSPNSDLDYETASDGSDSERSMHEDSFVDNSEDHTDISIFINGNTPSKTDIDVLRALETSNVSPTEFPHVIKWKNLVSSFSHDDRVKWQSPRPNRPASAQRLNRDCYSPLPGSTPLSHSTAAAAAGAPATSRSLASVVIPKQLRRPLFAEADDQRDEDTNSSNAGKPTGGINLTSTINPAGAINPASTINSASPTDLANPENVSPTTTITNTTSTTSPTTDIPTTTHSTNDAQNTSCTVPPTTTNTTNTDTIANNAKNVAADNVGVSRVDVAMSGGGPANVAAGREGVSDGSGDCALFSCANIHNEDDTDAKAGEKNSKSDFAGLGYDDDGGKADVNSEDFPCFDNSSRRVNVADLAEEDLDEDDVEVSSACQQSWRSQPTSEYSTDKLDGFRDRARGGDCKADGAGVGELCSRLNDISVVVDEQEEGVEPSMEPEASASFDASGGDIEGDEAIEHEHEGKAVDVAIGRVRLNNIYGYYSEDGEELSPACDMAANKVGEPRFEGGVGGRPISGTVESRIADMQGTELTDTAIPMTQAKAKEITNTETHSKEVKNTESLSKEIRNAESLSKEITNTESLSKEITNTESLSKEVKNTESLSKEIINTVSHSKEITNTESLSKEVKNTESLDNGVITQGGSKSKLPLPLMARIDNTVVSGVDARQALKRLVDPYDFDADESINTSDCLFDSDNDDDDSMTNVGVADNSHTRNMNIRL